MTLNLIVSQVISTEFKKALIAVGGRPQNMNFPGSEFCITSDDIFFLKKFPKKVIVIGGGYIAHECASYLNNLGSKVEMITRGRFMRVFDHQVADQLRSRMTEAGVVFNENSSPIRLSQVNGKLKLEVKQTNAKDHRNIVYEDVDLVLTAVARHSNAVHLNLQKVFGEGIKFDEKGKLFGGFNSETERLTDNIYAVGDCLSELPELTPIAIKSGKEISFRVLDQLKNIKKNYKQLNYKLFPTTVFTSPEYSYCGLSEEDAIKQYGKEKVICYHRETPILEKALTQNIEKTAYFKIICLRAEDEPIVGLHYIGPNAGEVMQGYSVAMNIGLSKKKLDESFGIHPTVAEDFIGLNKLSTDKDFGKTAC